MGKPIPLAKVRKTINACIYGDPGSGKTALIASSPNCLILDADDGVESAARLGRVADVWKCTDYHDLTEVYEYLRHEKHDYEWVWLDSGTLFQEKALHDQIMADVVANKPHRNEFIPDVQEYLLNQNQLAKFVRHFVGLDINFGFTAYAATYDLGEEDTVFMPMFQGKHGEYSTKLCGYLNFIGYLGAVETDDGTFKNRLITKRTGRYYAKDRFGAVDAVITNPDFDDITEEINNSF